jgi:hypothetical protein
MLNEDEIVFNVGTPVSRKSFDDATRLAEPVDLRLSKDRMSLCRGVRTFGRPLMALVVKKELGNIRHALSQMVVAGTMSVPGPVTIRVPSLSKEEEAE